MEFIDEKIKTENECIKFGSLEFEIDKNKIFNIYNKERKRKITKKEFKKINDKTVNTNINSDIYYIFVYIINIIFETKNIDFIRGELYNYLGELGIDFYKKQINIIS
jgi:hypothetical protein